MVRFTQHELLRRIGRKNLKPNVFFRNITVRTLKLLRAQWQPISAISLKNAYEHAAKSVKSNKGAEHKFKNSYYYNYVVAVFHTRSADLKPLNVTFLFVVDKFAKYEDAFFGKSRTFLILGICSDQLFAWKLIFFVISYHTVYIKCTIFCPHDEYALWTLSFGRFPKARKIVSAAANSSMKLYVYDWRSNVFRFTVKVSSLSSPLHFSQFSISFVWIFCYLQ